MNSINYLFLLSQIDFNVNGSKFFSFNLKIFQRIGFFSLSEYLNDIEI